MARKRPERTEATAAPTNGTETITKTEAVRRAIAEGHDMPIDGSNYIKDRFGLSVPPPLFSTTKSQLKKKGAIGGNGRRKGGRRKAAAAPVETVPTSSPGLVETARAVTAIQGLVRRFGKAAVRQLLDEVG